MRNHLMPIAIPLLAAQAAFAYTDSDGDGWLDSFGLENFTMVSKGENPYFALKPGQFVVLGEMERDGTEFVIITVLDETEKVDGVKCRVVEEREFEDGELLEVSRNFFAMAKETGDVFYYGEDVDDYEDGEVVGHSGAWRAGVDGAKPGLYMPAKPEVGQKFYMEIHPGVAMDRAEIAETGARVETPGGKFDDCLIVTESSALEPGQESYKRYAPEVGMIFDDGLELYQYGWRFASERVLEFEIRENQLPDVPAKVLYELHPEGDPREVKVELHKNRVVYAIETFVDGRQWDVEVTENGEVLRNEED